jgi:hypothetical protein
LPQAKRFRRSDKPETSAVPMAKKIVCSFARHVITRAVRRQRSTGHRFFVACILRFREQPQTT